MKQVTKRRLCIGFVVLVALLVVVVATSLSGSGGNHHEFTGFKQEADGLKAVFRVENQRGEVMTTTATIFGDDSESSSRQLSLRGHAMPSVTLPGGVRGRVVTFFEGPNPVTLLKIPIPSGLTNVVVSLEINEDRLADPSHPQVWTDAKAWLHSCLEKCGATNLAASLKWKKTTLVSPRR